MRTIHKYEVPVEDTFEQALPVGAEFLSVQTQLCNPQMWWEVDNKEEKERRKFAVVGTGHPMPPGKVKFLRTFQLHGGKLVFHLFELI